MDKYLDLNDERRVVNQYYGEFSAMDSHSPYRPDFVFTKQGHAPSPAFQFDSSVRRQGNQNYFFGAAGFNQDSVGKTPDANSFDRFKY